MLPLAAILLGGALLWLATDGLPRARLARKLRFRKRLSVEALHDQFFRGLADKASVMASLEFLRDNLDFPVGLLRPEDDLEPLDWGLPEGDIDLLLGATATWLSRVPRDCLESELGRVKTVRDYVATVSRLSRDGHDSR